MILIRNSNGEYLNKLNLNGNFGFTDNINLAYTYDDKEEAQETINFLNLSGVKDVKIVEVIYNE